MLKKTGQMLRRTNRQLVTDEPIAEFKKNLVERKFKTIAAKLQIILEDAMNARQISKGRMSKSYKLELQTPILMPKNLPEVCCRVEAVCCSPDQEEICCRTMIGENKPAVSYRWTGCWVQKITGWRKFKTIAAKLRIILEDSMNERQINKGKAEDVKILQVGAANTGSDAQKPPRSLLQRRSCPQRRRAHLAPNCA